MIDELYMPTEHTQFRLKADGVSDIFLKLEKGGEYMTKNNICFTCIRQRVCDSVSGKRKSCKHYFGTCMDCNHWQYSFEDGQGYCSEFGVSRIPTYDNDFCSRWEEAIER